MDYRLHNLYRIHTVLAHKNHPDGLQTHEAQVPAQELALVRVLAPIQEEQLQELQAVLLAVLAQRFQ